MGTTGLFFHPAYLEHDTGPGHPERPDRLRAILGRLRDGGVLEELQVERPTPADERWIKLVHTDGHPDRVRRACASGGMLDAGDTTVVPASFDAALLATGAALDAADKGQPLQQKQWWKCTQALQKVAVSDLAKSVEGLGLIGAALCSPSLESP